MGLIELQIQSVNSVNGFDNLDPSAVSDIITHIDEVELTQTALIADITKCIFFPITTTPTPTPYNDKYNDK